MTTETPTFLCLHQNISELVHAYCLLHKKCAIYLSYCGPDCDKQTYEDWLRDVQTNCPAILTASDTNALPAKGLFYLSGRAILLFDSEEARDAVYRTIICDTFDGTNGVYALTFGLDGEIQDENT